jgi:hypothetical protein
MAAVTLTGPFAKGLLPTYAHPHPRLDPHYSEKKNIFAENTRMRRLYLKHCNSRISEIRKYRNHKFDLRAFLSARLVDTTSPSSLTFFMLAAILKLKHSLL